MIAVIRTKFDTPSQAHVPEGQRGHFGDSDRLSKAHQALDNKPDRTAPSKIKFLCAFKAIVRGTLIFTGEPKQVELNAF